MIQPEHKPLVFIYSATVVVIGCLVAVIMNIERWFAPLDQSAAAPTQTGGLIEQRDLDFSLFDNEKFKGLSPLLTPEELEQLAEDLAGSPDAGPDASGRREVRRSNPFIPFN